MYKNKLLISISILYFININIQAVSSDDVEGYYWRDYKGGAVPKDALQGGRNANKNPTYIGQVLHAGLLIPAKIDPEVNKVAYEWGYKEFVTSQNVKILCTKHPEQFEWLNSGNGLIKNLNPDSLVVGGYEPGANMYIGRKEIDNELVLGKIISGPRQTTLNTAKDGIGTQHAEFQILSYDPNKNKNTQTQSPIDVQIDEKNTTCNLRTIIINYFN